MLDLHLLRNVRGLRAFAFTRGECHPAVPCHCLLCALCVYIHTPHGLNSSFLDPHSFLWSCDVEWSRVGEESWSLSSYLAFVSCLVLEFVVGRGLCD